MFLLNTSFHQLQTEMLFAAPQRRAVGAAARLGALAGWVRVRLCFLPSAEPACGKMSQPSLHCLMADTSSFRHPSLAPQLIDVERASLSTCSQGLLMAVLGHIADAEIRCRSGLPEQLQIQLLTGTLQDLRGMLADREKLAAAAAEAEQHQLPAGLNSPLSAAGLQRLALLLHFRCARHLNHAMLKHSMAAPELMHAESAINDELIALEGSGPMSACFLRRRGLSITERLQHSRRLPLCGPPLPPGAAAAAYEAALAACQSSKGKG